MNRKKKMTIPRILGVWTWTRIRVDAKIKKISGDRK